MCWLVCDVPKLRCNVTNKSSNVTNETALILCDVCCMYICSLVGLFISFYHSHLQMEYFYILSSAPDLLWTHVEILFGKWCSAKHELFSLHVSRSYFYCFGFFGFYASERASECVNVCAWEWEGLVSSDLHYPHRNTHLVPINYFARNIDRNFRKLKKCGNSQWCLWF